MVSVNSINIYNQQYPTHEGIILKFTQLQERVDIPFYPSLYDWNSLPAGVVTSLTVDDFKTI